LPRQVEDPEKVPSSPQASEWRDKNAGSVGASQGWYGTAHHACCLCVVSELAELKLSLSLSLPPSSSSPLVCMWTAPVELPFSPDWLILLGPQLVGRHVSPK
ncbi:hypothetical protein MUK42_20604, partial [Musa troglodytarum]